MLEIRHLAAVTAPAKKLDPAKIEFGKELCPNMFLMEYRNGAWQNPRVELQRELKVEPSAVVLQYGQTIFEGIKAFLTSDDRVVLFRPDKSAERFRASAQRLHMPIIESADFVKAVTE